jgi:ATP-dependent RNA helicase RhlE
MKDNNLNSFSTFGFSEPIACALKQEGYTTPTPIQSQAIPHVLAGRDLIGIAQTGTGKTAAFALPILNHLCAQQRRAERNSCRVLVLSPTRELSGQIAESFRTYGQYLRPSVAVAIGGVPMPRQVRALAHGVDVLVATPGRLIDLIRSNALRLARVELFVLDEADRMLDMGFIHDIRAIIAKLPARRQSLFFSATMPPPIAKLAEQMLQNPATVAVTPVASTAERVQQRVILVDRAAKPPHLVDILRGEPIERALVFTRTKHGADKVVRNLLKVGIAADAIHGNKSQSQRERVLAAFRAGQVRTLVATDIAARGIDVDGISHVINYDLPNIPENYVHRVGCTARAGAEGVAISLCDAEEKTFLREIEKLIRLSIPMTDRRRGSHASPPPRSDGAIQPMTANRTKHRRRKARSNRNGRASIDSRQDQRNGELTAIGFLQRSPTSRRHTGGAHMGQTRE